MYLPILSLERDGIGENRCYISKSWRQDPSETQKCVIYFYICFKFTKEKWEILELIETWVGL